MMAVNEFGERSIGEKDWKPHNCNIETNPDTVFTNKRAPGPDWSSSIKCLPVDNYEAYLDVTKKLVIKTGKKHFPGRSEESNDEWKFYSNGSEFGKRCIIQGEILGNSQTVDEVKLEKVIGTKTKVVNTRGGLKFTTLGDKSYSIPEYSTNFHQEGSTLPTVHFNTLDQSEADTFIPLQILPREPSVSYKDKEERRVLSEEKSAVKNLENWLPAPQLTPTL